MFIEFYYLLRDAHIPVSITEFLTFMEAIAKGHVNNTVQLYYVMRSLLVKDHKYYDHFDQCFSYYFGNANVPDVIREEIMDWLKKPAKSVFDFMKLSQEELDMIENYDMDTLRKMLEERLQKQREKHNGGNYWIGTGGTSPFGWGGKHPGGLRIGGSGGMGMAAQIAAQRLFKDYRSDRILDTRQIEIALKKLRKLKKVGAEDVLNIEETIDKTCRNGGEIEFVWEKREKNSLRLMLLMDVGGSMDTFTRMVEQLFSAASKCNHFREFTHYYFHNSLYEEIYEDAAFEEGVPLQDLFRKYSKDLRVIIVGDAAMAPYELFARYGAIDYFQQNETPSIEWIKRFLKHFPHTVWLNPEVPGAWMARSRVAIAKLMPMYQLSLNGLDKAIKELLSSR